MDFNLFLALFILLLRCSENCQQKPLKAGSWVFFFFFWHILISWATWLHSYIRSLGLIFYSFWKQPFYQGVQVPFMGGRSSQNTIWVPGVLLATGVSASVTSQQDSSSQSLGKVFPSGDMWQCLEVHDCHNWGDGTETEWEEAKDVDKHPTMQRQDSPTPQQICVYPRHQWCWSWEILS